MLFQCFYHVTTWLVPTGPLWGLPRTLSLIQFTLPNISARLILIPSQASLAHFIPLGILVPLYSFRHPWPNPFLHSLRLLLRLLGFPGPITISFTFEGLLAFVPTPFTNSFLWAPSAYFCFLSISYNSHGLTISLFGLPWSCLLPLRPFYYFTGPWTIIPTIRV